MGLYEGGHIGPIVMLLHLRDRRATHVTERTRGGGAMKRSEVLFWSLALALCVFYFAVIIVMTHPS